MSFSLFCTHSLCLTHTLWCILVHTLSSFHIHILCFIPFLHIFSLSYFTRTLGHHHRLETPWAWEAWWSGIVYKSCYKWWKCISACLGVSAYKHTQDGDEAWTRVPCVHCRTFHDYNPPRRKKKQIYLCSGMLWLAYIHEDYSLMDWSKQEWHFTT